MLICYLTYIHSQLIILSTFMIHSSIQTLDHHGQKETKSDGIIQNVEIHRAQLDNMYNIKMHSGK